ncbi:hypothetical protein MOV61_08035 [Neorhizobium sp. BETTINA12A]|uniref:hypothetical protein n=1 Tax=Neorhizobium sp. BETTINA12A TaxID=2908924 RepID=UPI001FF4DB58|nr:hypothetical protein [Neorhizobium sp. BETTINA12A]MCJ9750666.1 hypothetical protein [Neorhizobium sp. BETTINA12A]
MVANAVPAPLAEALGQVILAREFGHEIPRAEGRFVRWLRRHGKSPATARQIRSNVNTARRLLKGRIHAELAIELAVLETSLEFQALSGSRRSALRRALILYAEYLDYTAEKAVRKGRMRTDPAAPAVVGPDVYRQAV